jgi:hypothetical protein
MTALTIEVQDMARLVVPSPRRVPTTREMAAFVARLAPIEMATGSVHLHQPSSFLPLRANSVKLPEPVVPPAPRQLTIQAGAVPAGYFACGLGLCLCNVLVPDGVVSCAHLLSPLWTLALAMHALAYGDPPWMWLGALVAVLLPFVLLVGDPLFAWFYLVVFAVFGSGRFWVSLQGPAFILVCACWFGLAAACVLGLLADHPRAHLCVAVFFALALAIVGSWARFGKLRVMLA